MPSPPPLEFELLAEIATGPTARVELCRVLRPEHVAGHLVAVKRLHPHIAEDPQFAGMFVDEVWMTAALAHPNVVRVVGWGTDAHGTFLAVELVQGVSLARLMKTVFETREVFTERMVVHLGSEICAGLAAAHALTSPEGESLGLVHRDLTPGNVLLGFDGQVKIADFGLAKAKQRVSKTLTGLLKGHPHYMAPEQARDGPIDGRADLFSLGVVLFELFSGRHPWSGGNEIEIFHVMARDPPADLVGLRPRLDKELAAIVARLLDKDPDRRFRSADEVRARLLAWLDAHGYKDENTDSVARFVRRNAMRQMRWFERAVGGELKAEAERAKARLAVVQRNRQGQPAGVTTRSDPARSGSSARRRGRRVEEPTELDSSQGPQVLDPRLASTTPDRPPSADGEWSEEIPTVVKPTTHPGTSPSHLVVPVPPPGAGAEVLHDEDSDQKTTAVKPKSPAAALLLKKLPPPRISSPQPMCAITAPPTSESAPTRPMPAAPPRERPPLQPQDTLLDMVAPDMADLESEEIPTHPLRSSPVMAQLFKLPQPPHEPVSVEGDPELAGEAERLAQEAGRLRADAEAAAKLAAHKAVLAQLAAEAAQIAREAARQAPSVGRPQARAMLAEAHRLEHAFRRGEASPPSHTNGGAVTTPLPPQEPVSPMPISAPQAFGLPRPSAPPPEPIARPVFGHGPARASSAPPPRTMGEEIRLLLSGDVWGLPVPIALGVAFALALGLVIIAAVMVG